MVDWTSSGLFWRIREGRKGRWAPWVLGLVLEDCVGGVEVFWGKE